VPESEAQTEPEFPTEFAEKQARDGMLDLMLQVPMNDASVNPNVTLIVGGTFISGRIIGIKEWFSLFMEQLEGDEGWEPGVEVVEFPRYIHLKEAAAVVGGALVPSGGRGLLRIRLSDVQGWMPGSLARSK